MVVQNHGVLLTLQNLIELGKRMLRRLHLRPPHVAELRLLLILEVET